MDDQNAVNSAELSRVFHAEARLRLGQVARDHGASLHELENEFRMDLLSGARIRVELHAGHRFQSVTAMIEVLGRVIEPPNTSSEELGLATVVAYKSGSPVQGPRELNSAADVATELERLAAQLTLYCDDILSGDFSNWRRIIAFARAKSEGAVGGWTTMLREARVEFLRVEAARAFETREFERAATLYAQLGDALTSEERERLAIARRRLEA